MAYQSFFELDAWKRARAFKLAVYEVLKRLPENERYDLYSQLRRSVRSVSTNISEGHGRFTFKDQKNFCVIARGSLSETLNHLIDPFDSGYISRDELQALKSQWAETGKVLNGYMSFLQSRSDGGEGSKRNIQETPPLFNINDQRPDNAPSFTDHLDI